MQSIEPIIRLVVYQLEQILPLLLNAAGPSQSDDPTNLYLESPAQICNSYRKVQQDRWPTLVVSPLGTKPVDQQAALDMGCIHEHVHEFEVLISLTGTEKTVEQLTYVLTRYVDQVIAAVTSFEQQAVFDAFAASQLPPALVQIVPGNIVYEEPGNKTIILRNAAIEFTAYA